MKNLLSITVILILSLNGRAQFNYSVTTFQQAYLPLTNATSLNNGLIWDGGNNNFSAPLGFSFSIDTIKTTSDFILYQGELVMSDTTTSNAIALALSDAYFIDRGNIDSVHSRSPIRYAVSGPAGHHIFKAELFNAGFGDEIGNFATLNDSVDIQVWLYEDSNIVEYRYGPHRITHPDVYFSYQNNQPFAGLITGFDFIGGNTGPIYTLSGDPLAPTIDSIIMGGHMGPALNHYPDSGTVYRFTPFQRNATGVDNISFSSGSVSVYPSVCHDVLNVACNNDNTGPAHYAIISLSGTTTPLSGTLASGTNKVDVGSLASGIYIIQVLNGDSRTNKRFVKE